MVFYGQPYHPLISSLLLVTLSSIDIKSLVGRTNLLLEAVYSVTSTVASQGDAFWEAIVGKTRPDTFESDAARLKFQKEFAEELLGIIMANPGNPDWNRLTGAPLLPIIK